MTKFEQTEAYKSILENQSTSATIAYHIETDIDINEFNIEYYVAEEIEEYNIKISEIKKIIKDFPIDKDIADKIRDRVYMFMNKKLCIVEYTTLSYQNALDVASEIEKQVGFKEWLVK